MKQWLSPLFTAWTAVVTHKLRSFLTILGVVIGVGAVITLMSIGKGTESTMLKSFSALGTDVIFIQPGFTTQSGVRSSFGSAATLTQEDAEAILENVPNVAAVAPTSASGYQVIAGGQNLFARVTGITPDYLQVQNLSIAEGDPITQYQYEKSMRVALIGTSVRETLFSDSDPVGQTIRMGNTTFLVTGVLASKGASMMGSTDDVILVPLTTLQGMMARSRTASGEHIVSSITVKVMDEDRMAEVKNGIVGLLQYRHQIPLGGEDDFTVTSMDDLTSTISSAMNQMTLLLGAIAGISLLVGGIGVMNIMLVSVMERRREIGIRKALGAREMDIWGQFLLDSALLTLTGGIIGVALGWGLSYLISNSGYVTTLVTTDIVLLAVGVSVGIGVFFGFYPAWQGSRMDPIQALRSE